MGKTIYAIMNDSDFEKRIRQSAEKFEADYFSISNNTNFEDRVKVSIPKIIFIDLMSDSIDVEEIMSHVSDTRRLKYVSLIGIVPDSVKTNQISRFLTGRCNLVVTRTKFQRDIDHIIKRNL